MKYIENYEINEINNNNDYKDDHDSTHLFLTKCYVDVYKILSQSFIKINLIDNMVQLSACIVSIYKIIQKNN